MNSPGAEIDVNVSEFREFYDNYLPQLVGKHDNENIEMLILSFKTSTRILNFLNFAEGD